MGTVDPGTQMALGLLYYSQSRSDQSTGSKVQSLIRLSFSAPGNGEFELSADCWSAALSVTPEVSRVVASPTQMALTDTYLPRSLTGLPPLEPTVRIHDITCICTPLADSSSSVSLEQRSHPRQRRPPGGGHRRLPTRSRPQPDLHSVDLQPRSLMYVPVLS